MHEELQFTVAKALELQKALALAETEGADHMSGMDTPTVDVAGEPSAVLERATVGIVAPKTLHILQHKRSRVIQFRFQALAATASDAGKAPVGIQPALQDLSIVDDVFDAADWIVRKTLSIAQRGVDAALSEIIDIAEQHNKPSPGFIDLSVSYSTPATEDRLKEAHGRVLIFVHGIFSSIEKAFSPLGDPKASKNGSAKSVLEELIEHYDGNVFGYDHWTIGKRSSDNAAELLAEIPIDSNWTVDFVCHSRGGLIVRTVCAGAFGVGSDLPDAVSLRKDKITKVGTAIFVAAANQGSPLANPAALRDFLNVAAAMASFSPCLALDVVIALARAIVAVGTSLPSIAQLAPMSPLIDALNAADSLLSEADLYGSRANFDSANSALLETGALIDKELMPVPNDLVVPFVGVASPTPLIEEARLREFGSVDSSQNKVWHTEFFKQVETQSLLLDRLVGGPP